jgi:hypothetical protein
MAVSICSTRLPSLAMRAAGQFSQIDMKMRIRGKGHASRKNTTNAAERGLSHGMR